MAALCRSGRSWTDAMYFMAAKAPLTFDLISLLFLFIAKPPPSQDTQSSLNYANPVKNLCKDKQTLEGLERQELERVVI